MRKKGGAVGAMPPTHTSPNPGGGGVWGGSHTRTGPGRPPGVDYSEGRLSRERAVARAEGGGRAGGDIPSAPSGCPRRGRGGLKVSAKWHYHGPEGPPGQGGAWVA